MVKRITVDANVALKWFLDEDCSENARNLLVAFKNGDVNLYAPSILQYEVGNALWILAAKHSLIGREYAAEAYRRLLALPLQIVQLDPTDLKEAFDRTCELLLTLYDASYLVVAARTESQFVSADRELVKKTGKLVDSIHIEELKF